MFVWEDGEIMYGSGESGQVCILIEFVGWCFVMNLRIVIACFSEVHVLLLLPP